jgi:hypothetical protein
MAWHQLVVAAVHGVAVHVNTDKERWQTLSGHAQALWMAALMLLPHLEPFAFLSFICAYLVHYHYHYHYHYQMASSK